MTAVPPSHEPHAAPPAGGLHDDERSPEDEQSAPAGDPAEWRWERLVDDLGHLLAGVKRLGEIELDEARLRLHQLVARALLSLLGGLLGLALLLLLVRELVLGASGGLAVAFDSPWLGRLVTGAGGLLAVALLARLALAHRARAELSRLQRKYPEDA